MRLTKLDILGFKSFARKTELAFGNGITAVIGPNGSGKSNIADAVRWVLGEQSARALRGTKMEDVIFGGTQQKKALSYCEVTLTFDNSDHLLPLAFEEVAITRRVYRSGESEYCINRNNCRLKDIQELFHDTGIGKDGYSIIGQGKVDEILSNKSNDRRTALEEAAGVMRYRVRKEEAERKLSHTEKNLERIEDILFELQDRLEPLEEQSRTARTYLKLRDELKDFEINVFLHQSLRMQERLAGIREEVAQLQKDEELHSEKESSLLSDCAETEALIQSLEQQLTQGQNQMIALLSGVEARVGECNLLIERRDRAKTDRAQGEESLKNLLQKAADYQEQAQALTADTAQKTAMENLDRELEEKNQRLVALDEQLRADEEALENMKASIIEAMNRLSDARSLLTHFETMYGALESRITQIREEIVRASERRDSFASEQQDADSVMENLERQGNDLLCKLALARQDRDQAEEKLKKLQRNRENLTGKLLSMQSRRNALGELAKNREGYYESVKLLMRDAAENPALKDAILGVVAELIQVPAEYEQAITMSLGSSLQNIVTRTPEDAKVVIDYLRKKEYGRATLLPLNLLRISNLSPQERNDVRGEGVIGFAPDLITYDPRIENAVSFLLGRTVIVRDLESGIAFKKRTGNSFHIATLGGDIISTGGSMSGGSQKKRNFSLLGREREIAQLDEDLKAVEAEKAALQKTEETLNQQLLLLDTQIQAFQGAYQENRIEQSRQQEKLDIIKRDLDESDGRLDQLREEEQAVQENLADLVREREEADRAQSGLEAGNAATREDVSVAQKALYRLRAERETLSEEIAEDRVRRMALEKEQDALLREQRRLTQEGERCLREAEGVERKLSDLQNQMVACETRLAQMQAQVEQEQGEASEFKTAQQDLEDEKTGLQNRLAALRKQREDLLMESRDRTERIHKQELAQNRIEMELSSMENHIWEEYALTYENALPYRKEISLTAANGSITRLKNEIKELGEINLSSIEEFKAVEERHGSLSVQRDDLRMAKTDLENMIVDLTATMEREFSEKFQIIQENFTKVFSELFGGGHAELRLADKNDALNCDIDIIAQPPGKKLQLLSLLSGGERALTAIALLFAMLRIKPPAFCVLDEIESSLDEANVARFADFLKDYSGETQFIIITHRRGSMAVCDTLYGVSMEEKGISKVVSARLEENS
ncbi:MAG: chromosome segregation protein SMC [Clostridia bacterium]|nr:chromosome segregation protein SMC [Clostridia bacterium]